MTEEILPENSQPEGSNQLHAPMKPHPKPRKAKAWHEAARRPTPYNPLDLDNLGWNMEAQLMTCAPEPLAEVAPVYGSGVYALYYTGQNPLYAEVSSPDCKHPMYVGQARTGGVRKGRALDDPKTVVLWDRLYEHRQSISQVHDLDIADFQVRYLVAIEAFVSLAERVIIKHYHPVWNSVVDGFGNHDPGANRRPTSRRPPWDELHPGRWWSHPANMPTPSKVPASLSRDRIRALLSGKLSESEIQSIEVEIESGADDG
ncbi:Eco29kI family restriction endonuclease [Streptomyces olindensis]|uniref:Eco29kI family restriction endonuclease n=1 Tax=Streptomyces olindensis TaxID=358823 RepID=UPI0033EF3D15